MKEFFSKAYLLQFSVISYCCCAKRLYEISRQLQTSQQLPHDRLEIKWSQSQSRADNSKCNVGSRQSAAWCQISQMLEHRQVNTKYIHQQSCGNWWVVDDEDSQNGGKFIIILRRGLGGPKMPMDWRRIRQEISPALLKGPPGLNLWIRPVHSRRIPPLRAPGQRSTK